MYLVRLEDDVRLPLNPELIDNRLTRNHGMLRTKINGTETIVISGAEGIFNFEQLPGNKWSKKHLFENEVSEFGFVDLDGDGREELVTIEPFHGEALNVYKQNGTGWELKFSDTLSFGHGLSCGYFNNEPVIIGWKQKGVIHA